MSADCKARIAEVRQMYLMRPASWLRTPRVSSIMAELHAHTTEMKPKRCKDYIWDCIYKYNINTVDKTLCGTALGV